MAQIVAWFPRQTVAFVLIACIWNSVHMLDLRKTYLRDLIAELEMIVQFLTNPGGVKQTEGQP